MLVGVELFRPSGVIRGVEGFRGVGVALRGGVGEGVQVGNIWKRFVALGRIGVGGTIVAVDLSVGVEQAVSNMKSPRKKYIRLLTKCLPSGYGLPQHSLPAQRLTVV